MDPQDVLAMADERFERRLAQEAGAIRLEIAGVRRELADQAAALRQEIAGVRQELAKESAALRQEIGNQTTAVRQEFAELKEKMADWRTDIIKWSFVFWTGQVLTTIGFLLVILRTR